MNFFERKAYRERLARQADRQPRIRRLKRWSWAMIALCLVLMITLLVLTICVPETPWQVFYALRGCAGLAAIAFAIVYAIYLYRLNVAIHSDTKH